MLERFQGDAADRRLLEAIERQMIVNGNSELARQIASTAELVELQPNEQLIQRGAPDDHLYLVLSGSLSVEINNLEVARRAAGTHVGEMAALDPAAARSATVKALEPAVVAKLTEPQLDSLAREYPEGLEASRDRACRPAPRADPVYTCTERASSTVRWFVCRDA